MTREINYICHYYTSQGVDFVFRCINRLDKNTSGLTIIAKNILSSALLQRQVKEKTLQRTYLAICELGAVWKQSDETKRKGSR